MNDNTFWIITQSIIAFVVVLIMVFTFTSAEMAEKREHELRKSNLISDCEIKPILPKLHE